MTLNVRDLGKASPYMVLHDPSYIASVSPQSAKSLHLRTEHRFSRPEQLRSSSMDLHFRESRNQDSGHAMPNGPVLSTDMYQVHLPDWHERYTVCMKHFLDQAQYSSAVQSLAAYINIRLPFQRSSDPVTRFIGPDATSSVNGTGHFQVSLRHYIRRLIVTANDTPGILEAFFGSDWVGGVGSICKQERMNYLFTAKSNGWASTKAAYDILPDEHTPFVRPIQGVTEQELSMADTQWSEWLAMEDWMVGSRSPWG